MTQWSSPLHQVCKAAREQAGSIWMKDVDDALDVTRSSAPEIGVVNMIPSPMLDGMPCNGFGCVHDG
jgi:hypothetical protein